MELGIDLGTTRTIVAVHDRGNYPIVGFSEAEGDLIEHYPTVTAEVGGALIHGLDAEVAEREGAPSLRSWKRLLASTRQDELIRIGDVEVTAPDLVAGFVEALRRDLLERSNISKVLREPLDVVVSVPANAHSTQRFVTLEAFRRAGFRVRAMINEPSAAGIEYAHRHKNTLSSKREHVLVYDLGGGTFDAALVYIAAGHHDIAGTTGVAQLGGDDFDAQLCAMALEKAGRDFPDEPKARADLLRECRAAKEALHPNTKRIVLDLEGLGPDAPTEAIVIPVAEFYERTRPLVIQTLDALEPLVATLREEETQSGDIAGIYMVGGGTGLPVVPRVVKERFGRRVHRSPHPAAATAMGCAILAAGDDARGLVLSERFSRHFGVFREAEQGQRCVFDPVFSKGTPMPPGGSSPLVATRRYRAAHNVGHFRFVESAYVDDQGDPTGDLTPHAEILFPFASGLKEGSLRDLSIDRLPSEGPMIEERYEVDAAGVIAVTITNLDANRGARFVL
ncbi:MAG: Hsp70 family protein [Polyangiaceae bacterium]|jgi:molecular chaperone DnaK (HSP70)|nr:Hsp70 family protein [Polyangiaceae bacterium]MBK8942926.1 Hsp70 family protein [Polyangiaceae bacterium]